MLPLVLLAVFASRLRLVLAPVLVGPGRLANHLLARSVRVLGRRVRDHVLEVREHRVVAGTAVDRVLLAVASVERVVAVAAVQGVAGRVVGAVDVGARERPQVVVAGVAEFLVDPLVREDAVVAVAAVQGVVTGAAGDQVLAAVPLDVVVAGAAVEAVLRVAADDHVVAGAAEDSVAAADPVARDVAAQVVVARVAGD